MDNPPEIRIRAVNDESLSDMSDRIPTPTTCGSEVAFSEYTPGVIKPKRIILVRHEQSLGNIDESAYSHIPDWKIPLTDAGRVHGEITGKAVKELVGDDPVYFYTSPYLRTKETCQLILENFDPMRILGVREEPRIVEQQFGNFQDEKLMQKAKAERRRYGAFFYRFPNGESGLDVYNRTADYISTLFRDFCNPLVARESLNVIVVTHGLTMRLFLMRWFQYSVEEFENTVNPCNGGVIVMERHQNIKGDQWYELTKESLEHVGYPRAAKAYAEHLTECKSETKHKRRRKSKATRSLEAIE